MTSAACNAVFATSGYEASVANFAMTSLSTDMVFSDGSTLQVGNVTGDASAGYALTLTVGVAVQRNSRRRRGGVEARRRALRESRRRGWRIRLPLCVASGDPPPRSR